MARVSTQLDFDRRGLLDALLGEGRFLVILTGLCLVLAGGFALFLSATGHFLPHDIAFLGMTADELCGINECRIVHFMFHDRVSFGAVLIAIGSLYMWLAEFPLKHHEAWAWWTLALSGTVGFASFLSYLGYGYLDYWHAIATLFLLPCFLSGLVRSWMTLNCPKGIYSLRRAAEPPNWKGAGGLGRICLLFTACGVIGAGFTISIVGMTAVFVPQDIAFLGVSADYLRSVNSRLVPLIAHDRAGFGGGLCSVGIAMLLCVWFAPLTRSLKQVLTLAGAIGFGFAIAVHFMIGYTDFIHLLPACGGAVLYAVGLGLSFTSTDL